MAKKSKKASKPKYERTNKEALDAVIIALFENTGWDKEKIAARVSTLFQVSTKTVENSFARVEDEY